jgi:diguanylate cyclase (GGDEF)-like protein
MSKEKNYNPEQFFNYIESYLYETKNSDSDKLKNDAIIFNFFEHFSGLPINLNDSLKYIQNIRNHCDNLNEKLGRDVGYGVAILDYFFNIDKRIKNPKIIEMEFFKELLRSSKEDQKTGLLNSQYFNELLVNEINRAKRNVYPVSVLFIDLDDFKKFNDVYGHILGDKYLVYIARSIKQIIRREDFAARFGGDEFIIMLPHTDKIGTEIVAKRLLFEINNYPFFIDEEKKEKYNSSLSLGYSTFPFDSEEANDLVQKADLALYEAKKNGKNQIFGYGYSYINNKRENFRYNCNEKKIQINLSDLNNNYTAFIKNISESGMLVNIPDVAKLLIGINLRGEIDLGCKNSNEKIEFKGKIIYTKKNDNGILAAIKFENKINNVDIIINNI